MKNKFRIITIMVCIAAMLFAMTACSNKDEWESGAAEGSNAAKDTKGNLTEFTTETMDGNTVNQDILKDYNMTMINIWSTTCGYCIDEMPALQQLSQQMPEGVQFLSICMDASMDKDLANKILSENGATFTTLMDSESLNENFLGYIQYTPTTVFVDSNGKIVGEPKVGAFATNDTDEIVKQYLDELNLHLLQM